MPIEEVVCPRDVRLVGVQHVSPSTDGHKAAATADPVAAAVTDDSRGRGGDHDAVDVEMSECGKRCSRHECSLTGERDAEALGTDKEEQKEVAV